MQVQWHPGLADHIMAFVSADASDVSCEKKIIH